MTSRIPILLKLKRTRVHPLQHTINTSTTIFVQHRPNRSSFSERIAQNRRPTKFQMLVGHALIHDGQNQQAMSLRDKAIRTFAEKVSICGLFDFYQAKTKWEKLMWYAAYVMAICGIIYSSIGLIAGVRRQRSVYTDTEIVHGRAPFPNVTVCTPELIDRRFFLDTLQISKKLREYLIKEKLDANEIVDMAMENAAFNFIKPDDLNETALFAMVKIISAVVAKVDGGYPSFLQKLYPKCDEIFGHCRFGGREFDCCRVAKFVPHDNALCYQLEASSFQPTTTTATSNSNSNYNPDQFGLIINVSLDFSKLTYINDLAENGFKVYIGSTVSMFSTPLAIPSNMDAWIVLSTPKLCVEQTDCRPNSTPLKLTYFDHYDENGVNCRAEAMIDMFVQQIGCFVPALTMDAKNVTPCAVEVLHALTQGITDVKNGTNVDLVRTASSIYNNRSCQPLCTRWQYSITSASYNSWHYHNADDQRQRLASKPWSQIRIFFPTTSHWVHVEERRNSVYNLIYNIGMLLQAYAGVSAVTFGEILAYGVCILATLPLFDRIRAM